MRSRLGIVSNCWKMQLDSGATLASLVERGLAIGLRHFELRQGALGECEAEDRTPLPEPLDFPRRLSIWLLRCLSSLVPAVCDLVSWLTAWRVRWHWPRRKPARSLI